MRSQIPIAQLHHPFIMLLNGYFMHENYHYLEIQLGVGPLSNYIITDHEQAFKVMFQISSAINYIHSLHILHGDINPNNIVLMKIDVKDPIARLNGFARKLENDLFCTCHNQTYAFSGSEINRKEPLTFSSDIWSVGATFYYIVTHKRLIKAKSEKASLLILFFHKNFKNL